MRELDMDEVENVCGGDWGATASCLAVGRMAAGYGGAAAGPWGAVGGFAIGCAVGVGSYYYY